jgi:hypothetical protein
MLGHRFVPCRPLSLPPLAAAPRPWASEAPGNRVVHGRVHVPYCRAGGGRLGSMLLGLAELSALVSGANII